MQSEAACFQGLLLSYSRGLPSSANSADGQLKCLLSRADHDGDLGTGIADDSEDMRPVKMSALTFVDLAGSERMNQLDRDESSQRIRQTEVGHPLESNMTFVCCLKACIADIQCGFQ